MGQGVLQCQVWESLDTKKVQQGRQKELDIVRLKVKKDMPIVTCKLKGIKLVNAKWLDDKKPTASVVDNVRSRMVATRANWHAREDCTQATPPHKVFIQSSAGN